MIRDIGATWHTIPRQVQRWWRHWFSWRAVLTLSTLLLLGVIEPVACIIHCQYWLPMHHQQMAGHAHHEMMSGTHHMDVSLISIASGGSFALYQAMNLPQQTPSQADQSTQVSLQSNENCHVLPSPFHEVAPALFGILLLLIFTARAIILFIQCPPEELPLPSFRPPIALLSATPAR